MDPNLKVEDLANLFKVCERTVRRYLKQFQLTGEVQAVQARHGPKLLLGKFEQLTLLRIILDKPGIYLKEVQSKLIHVYGTCISLSTIL